MNFHWKIVKLRQRENLKLTSCLLIPNILLNLVFVYTSSQLNIGIVLGISVFSFLFFSLIEHKSNTIELHPKVRPICLNILFPAVFLFDIHSFIFRHYTSTHQSLFD